ncbi:MAG: UDP-N-acetylmuramate--L-alanine ligase [Saprospiraceae bacterium]
MSGKGYIYFLGIGGIGMSAIARYFHLQGEKVCGYDRTPTELTEELIKEGIPVVFVDDVSSVPDNISRVIWTPAIPRTNHIFRHFVELGVTMHKRSAVLGEITSQYPNIAIAGTHGKTTTGTIVSHLLAYNKFPVTAFLGGVSVNYRNNFIHLGNQWMIEEADEYDQSFLQLNPDIAVITAVDADHLDIYGSRTKMLEGYAAFAGKVRNGGLLLLGPHITESDRNFLKKSVHHSVRILNYGHGEGSVQCTIRTSNSGWMGFDYIDEEGRRAAELSMRLPGQHNIENATAAIRIALELGISQLDIREALLSFKGIRRRFEWLHEGSQVLIDDYAHHPEELRAAIAALRQCYPNRKLLGIFQPHLFTRTRDFAQQFAEVLDQLDDIILVELYPAREEPLDGISSYTILDKMKNPHSAFIRKEDLLENLKNYQTDVIALLGAGDLSAMQDQIIKILR